MLDFLSDIRAGSRRLAAGALLLLPAAGCAGGDLLLPEDLPEDRSPVQLRAVSGDGQSAVVGAPVPNPLVVVALDAAGRPVEGAVIVFEFVDPPAGAAIAPQVSATNPDGLAAAEVTLGTPAGDQPVEAKLEDPERDLSVRFLLTAIPSNDDGGGGGEGGGGDDDDGGGGDGGPPGDGGGGGGGGGGNDNGGGGGGGDGGRNDDGGGGGRDDNGGNNDDGNGGGGDDDRNGGGGNRDDGDDGGRDGGGGGDDDGDDDNEGEGGGGGDDDDDDDGNRGKDKGRNEREKHDGKGDRKDND